MYFRMLFPCIFIYLWQAKITHKSLLTEQRKQDSWESMGRKLLDGTDGDSVGINGKTLNGESGGSTPPPPTPQGRWCGEDKPSKTHSNDCVDSVVATNHPCYPKKIYHTEYRPKSPHILKRQCHEIFCFWFFSWIIFPQAPENNTGSFRFFFENSRRYSQVIATGVNDTSGPRYQRLISKTCLQPCFI